MGENEVKLADYTLNTFYFQRRSAANLCVGEQNDYKMNVFLFSFVEGVVSLPSLCFLYWPEKKLNDWITVLFCNNDMINKLAININKIFSITFNQRIYYKQLSCRSLIPWCSATFFCFFFSLIQRKYAFFVHACAYGYVVFISAVTS